MTTETLCTNKSSARKFSLEKVLNDDREFLLLRAKDILDDRFLKKSRVFASLRSVVELLESVDKRLQQLEIHTSEIKEMVRK